MMLLAVESTFAVLKLHVTSTILWLTCPFAVYYFFNLMLRIEVDHDLRRIRNMNTVIYLIHPAVIRIAMKIGLQQGMVMFLMVSAVSACLAAGLTIIGDKVHFLRILY